METDTAVIVFVHEETEVEFHWHGGAYIDVGYTSERDGEFTANDVINVWDDEHDKSHFEMRARGRTARPFRDILEQFETRCREYMDEGQPENEEDAR